MLRSLYIASTGMLAQRKKMDIVTNNIINIDTTGYKKDTLISKSFKDLMIEGMSGSPGSSLIGPQNSGVHVDDIVTSFDQGDLEQTGRLTDLALQGEGFFVISTPRGLRYTRDGAFAVSPGGYLVNSSGNYVQGTNGNIYVGSDEFTIDEQGNVIVDDVTVNRLQVVTFGDLTGLEKEGANMFAVGSAGAARLATDYAVKQGYLESSNVSMAEEMVTMVELNRAYQVNQRVLTMLDQSLGKTVNEVGKV
jgi:flagellar basal-body rod protein FlgG